MEMLARNYLRVVNTGEKPTFERGDASSIINLKAVSQGLARHVSDWGCLHKRVLKRSQLHTVNYRYFTEEYRNPPLATRNLMCKGYNAKKIDKETFLKATEVL